MSVQEQNGRQDYEIAETDFQVMASNSLPVSRMGEILVRRGQHEEALPHLAIALNGAPGSLPRVHALLSKIYAFQGRTVEAITELKQALRADSDGSYHYQLYQLYKKIGDPKAATTALEKSKSIRRNRVEPPQQRTTLDRDSFR